MKDLIEVLKEYNLTIASVESITGGLFASSIVSVSGSSEVYLGSLVTYANIIKEKLLNIEAEFINKYGVVSSEVAKEMAKQANKLINSDIMISFSGNAGPNTLENKPVGSIYSCIKYHNDYYEYYDHLSGERNEIRLEIVNLSKDRIIQIIRKGEYNGKR